MGRTSMVVLATVALAAGVGAPAAMAQSSFQDEVANLRSPNPGTRVKAAKALGRSGRPEAIPPLTEAMRDPEVKVRKVVVEALRGFHSTEAVDGLLLGARDEEKDIREQAMLGLAEIYVGEGNVDSGGALSFLLRRRNEKSPVLSGLIPVDSRVVESYEQRLLVDEESDLRERAAESLGLLRAPEAVDSLGAALSDPDEDVRLASVHALGEIGTDAAGESLRRALQGTSTKLSGAAVDALGRMRYLPAADDLVSIYDGNVNQLGDRALRSLALMGAPSARGVFYYQMTSEQASQRRWAVEGLGRLDDPSLVPGMMKDFLREPEPTVQLAYCFSLSRLGRPEFVDRIALSLADKGLREQARAYAVELGSPLLSELVTYLSDPVPEVRREMALVLMEIGDPAAIPYLEPLLADPDQEVADRANRAIAHLRLGRVSASRDPEEQP